MSSAAAVLATRIARVTPITLAHSPDSDDAFMFYGLSRGEVDTEGLVFSHELSDIESLKSRAMAGELDVTAVSFHAYAYWRRRPSIESRRRSPPATPRRDS